MSKALYRKYRPKSLADVIGQHQVTDALSGALKLHKISHAYLFIGPRGTGKTSVARIFAHEIEGFKYSLEDHYIDIIEIDAASNTGVDNIRELREKAVIAPSEGKYKIYIIDEVHMLSKPAFNALLKTLEEPPEHVIFIMATTDAYKVPVTITSRAQTYTFKLADADTMFKHLRKIADAEKIAIDDDALKIIVRRGGGSFRDSLSLLDQISALNTDQITAASVTAALGLPEDQVIADLLSSTDLTNTTALLKDLFNSGIKPEILAEELISAILANPTPEKLPILAKLSEIKEPFAEAKLLLAFCTVPTSVLTPVISAKRAPIVPPKTPSPTPVSKPAPSPLSSEQPQALTSFDWQAFCDAVYTANSAIASQLQKCQYSVENGALHLRPQTKFSYSVLSRDRNRQILSQNLTNLALVIHEFAATAENSAPISQISAIMGDIQEVNTNGGSVPF